MRSRLALSTLAALTAACASMPGLGPHRPTPAPTGSVAAPPSTTPPEAGLQAVKNPRIDQWEHRLRTKPSLRRATEDSLARAAPYLPRLCAILGQYGLPPDLVLLPVVESEF